MTWRFLEISRGPGDVRRFQEIKCWRFLVNGDVFLDSNGDPFLMVNGDIFFGKFWKMNGENSLMGFKKGENQTEIHGESWDDFSYYHQQYLIFMVYEPSSTKPEHVIFPHLFWETFSESGVLP